VRFGGFSFDRETLELRRGAETVPLPPQPSRLLALLLERPGRLVTRAEIQRRLWPETVVEFDHGINTCVRQIREALGENARSPVLLQTVPRRGYRFVVPAPAPIPGGGPRPRAWARGAVALAALAAVITVALRAGPGRLGTADDSMPGEPAPAARESYYKARYLLRRGQGEAAARFHEALRADASFAPALGGLARAHFVNGDRDSAEIVARQALAREPRLAEAHLVLADVSLARDWDWPAAEAHVAHAVALAPDLSEVHHARAFLLSVLGRHADAAAAMRMALTLDPVSPLVRGDAGWLDLWARRYDEAVRRCGEALELDSSAVGADLCLLYAHALRGRPAEAVPHALRVLAVRGQLREAGRLAAVADAGLALRNYWRASVALLDTLPENRVDPYAASVVRAMAADVDGALTWLERAAESRSPWVVAAGVDPRLDGIRHTSRYRAVIHQLGLDLAPPIARATGRRTSVGAGAVPAATRGH
jgi:tetratricopeptide (TPR) repeat protein